MILTCGEALIDMIPMESTAGPGFVPRPGGAVFNTSIALGRLGAPVRFFTGLSTDMFGEMLSHSLSESNVDTGLCHRSKRPTTLAFVALNDGQAQYTFYDEGSAGRMLRSDNLPKEPDCTAAFFGGISLASEPCGSSFEILFQQLRKAGKVLMLDPNIRPDIITNETAYRNRLERMIEDADIVKMSDEDMAWFLGPGSVQDHCEALLERGPALAICTEGAQGATAHTRKQEVMLIPPKVTVVDTIGAGDTFNAGLLAGLWEGGHLSRDALKNLSQPALREALDLAVRAAAHVVTQTGANPPTRAELG